MRFLRIEFLPTISLVLALAQMASFADQGVMDLSYAVAALFSFISLACGLGGYLYLRRREVAAARIALSTGVLFFVLLFGLGEYLFSYYFPT